MLVLTFGSSFHQHWGIAGLQLIHATVYSLLIAFRNYNWLSLNRLFTRLRPNG
jgi:hypothetical protein